MALGNRLQPITQPEVALQPWRLEFRILGPPILRVQRLHAVDGPAAGEQAGLQWAVHDHSGVMRLAPGDDVGCSLPADQGEGWLHRVDVTNRYAALQQVDAIVGDAA